MGSADEGMNLDDLEAGTREFDVGDMPDIPEASGHNTADLGARQGEWSEKVKGEVLQAGSNSNRAESVGRPRRGTTGEREKDQHPHGFLNTHTGRPAGQRIDPRTGVVSPQAVARDSAVERGELPMAATAPRRAETDTIHR